MAKYTTVYIEAVRIVQPMPGQTVQSWDPRFTQDNLWIVHIHTMCTTYVWNDPFRFPAQFNIFAKSMQRMPTKPSFNTHCLNIHCCIPYQVVKKLKSIQTQINSDPSQSHLSYKWCLTQRSGSYHIIKIFSIKASNRNM